MSKLALGTVQFGTDYGINSGVKVQPDEVSRIINFARNNGINLLNDGTSYAKTQYRHSTFNKDFTSSVSTLSGTNVGSGIIDP